MIFYILTKKASFDILMLNMAIEQDLLKVGLNTKEAQTYLALLELGPTTVVALSRKSGLKRTTIYEILKSLLERGLVVETPVGKRKRFIAEPPEKFFALKKQELDTLRGIVPTLEALRNVAIEKPAIQFFQGVDAIQKVFEDMCLNTDPVHDKLLAIETRPDVSLLTRTGEQYWMNLLAKKKKRGLESFTIEAVNREAIEKFAELRPWGFDHGIILRVIEDSEKQFNLSFYLYQNKIALVAEDQLFAFVIENQRLKKSFEFLFYQLWANAKPTKFIGT